MKKLYKKIIFWGVAASIGAGIGIYYFVQQRESHGPIYDYIEQRDLAPILDLFKTDTYWLLANPDTDPAYLIRHKTPKAYDPFYMGKLRIKVLRHHDQFIGFVAYYKKTFREGFLLFVAVKPEFRGKRHAETLIQYALEDLKRMGVAQVHLVTRTDNLRAQAVYKRLGFVHTQSENGFVYFAKNI